MDLDQLYEITSETISDYDIGLKVPESNVAAIANLLLDCGEKGGRYGYVHKSEALVRYSNHLLGMDGEGSGKKSRKSVVQGYEEIINGGLIRVERIRGGRKVLVVEFKSDHDFNPGSSEQLRAYMMLAEFPNGLLLSQRRATFYKRNINRSITQTHVFVNISHHVRDIADIIREM